MTYAILLRRVPAKMEEYVIAAMLGHGKKNVTRRYAQAMADQMRPVILAVKRLYLNESSQKVGNS